VIAYQCMTAHARYVGDNRWDEVMGDTGHRTIVRAARDNVRESAPHSVRESV
jgi:hypothetical protein